MEKQLEETKAVLIQSSQDGSNLQQKCEELSSSAKEAIVIQQEGASANSSDILPRKTSVSSPLKSFHDQSAQEEKCEAEHTQQMNSFNVLLETELVAHKQIIQLLEDNLANMQKQLEGRDKKLTITPAAESSLPSISMYEVQVSELREEIRTLKLEKESSNNQIIELRNRFKDSVDENLEEKIRLDASVLMSEREANKEAFELREKLAESMEREAEMQRKVPTCFQ